MNFARHSNLAGKHAFLSASAYSWIRYDDEKLIQTWTKARAKERGTQLHELASQCIKLGQKLPDTTNCVNQFVNDAIGYKMQSEQVLYYSDNVFGTADAISFKNNKLRIHDLKTGESGSMDQLLVYTAIFCLEYDVKPSDIDIELRLYQGNKIITKEPTVDEIVPIIDKIVHFDVILDKLKFEEQM